MRAVDGLILHFIGVQRGWCKPVDDTPFLQRVYDDFGMEAGEVLDGAAVDEVDAALVPVPDPGGAEADDAMDGPDEKKNRHVGCPSCGQRQAGRLRFANAVCWQDHGPAEVDCDLRWHVAYHLGVRVLF